MSKTYRRNEHSDEADFQAMVRGAAARRSAKKLALLAWGDAAIADQDLRDQLVSCTHA